MLKSKLTNPFRGIEKAEPDGFRRVNTSVDKENYSMLRRIRPEAGTIDATFNQLYCKLIQQLRSRGITDYTQVEQFEDFVMRSVLVLPEELTNNKHHGPESTTSGPGSTEPSLVQQTETSNVPPGTPGGNQPYSAPPRQPTSLPSSSAEHRKGRPRKGTKEGTTQGDV